MKMLKSPVFLLPRYNNLAAYVRRHYRTLWPFLSVRRAANVFLALVEMKLRRTTCRSRPFMFRVDPSTACNLGCPSCATPRAVTTEKRMMPLAYFQRIVDRIARTALRVSLYDQGEPFLNKDIYSMIGYATDHRISTLISTNLTLPLHLDELFASQLTVLAPCLDGVTQDTYGKYRRGGDVERVKSSIAAVMVEKRSRGAKWPFVDAQVILFKHLKEEMPLIEQFLSECRVDTITYRKEHFGFDPMNSAQPEDSSNPRCFWLYLGMMVRPDGNAYPCCGRGFNRLPYGNLLQEDLSDIWNNDYYRFSRALFSEGPDLPYDERMKRIPCLTCESFHKRRGMAPATSPLRE
jgi:MoaA/NifB/PqqE/SkfB family radical SAM enzyme